MTTTLDQRINGLEPGQEIRISGTEDLWVTAERSGNGKWLRFVRHTPNGFMVFKTTRF
jgi:rRNA maturation protein Rpf1